MATRANSTDKLQAAADQLKTAASAENDAAKELRETVFKGKKVKSLQPAKDGSGMAAVEW